MGMKPGAAWKQDRKLRMIRQAQTTATSRYGVGGREKTKNAPRIITLPKFKLDDKVR